MLHTLLFGSLLFAGAPLDAKHAAVVDAITREGGGMSCPQAEVRTAALDADIRSLGRVGGDEVVIVHLSGGCLCGAHNCPVYAVELTPGKPRVLLSTFGYGLSTHADAELPRIVVRGHDSALDAAKGQRLLIDGVRSKAKVSLTLFGPGSTSLDVRAGTPLTLPASGQYQLHVDNGAEKDVSYALTLSIR